MLDAIGVGSLEDLFADIPESRPPRARARPAAGHVRAGGATSTSPRSRRATATPTRRSRFLGAGMYDHYVPALIDAILRRSEFLTPYTPYQPEISQGGAAGDVRVPDRDLGADRAAGVERVGLRGAERGGRRRLPGEARDRARASSWSRAACTRTRARRSRTHAAGYGMEVVEVPLDDDGATDLEALAAAVDDDTAAVFVQQPNFLGTVEDLGALAEAAKRTGALLVCAADPLPLGILKPPGELGVDICVGEGQSLGNRLDFGGPSFGFFAADERFIRKMPGRIAGETRDVDGKRGFVLTLQTREQHIRREKATHNICTAQALNALAGVVYLSWLGKRGPRRARRADAAPHRTTRARRSGSSRSTRARWCASSPCACRTSTRSFERARAAGINPGYRARPRLPRVRGRPARGDHRAAHARSTSTGSRTLVGGARRCRREASSTRVSERHAHDLRALARGPARVRRRRPRTCPRCRSRSCCRRTRSASARPSCPRSPSPRSCATTRRSRAKNFHLDTGFYPLGSCTMKHNPKLHERVAALPGHARLHPLQDPRVRAGRARADVAPAGRAGEIAGLPHVSLQPSAGSHGELAGLLLTRAYHEDRGEQRTQGAHAGHRARHQPGDGDDGRLRGREGRHRRRTAGWTSTTCARRPTDDVACLMLTNPNTLGLFDRNIEEIAADRPRRRARRSTTTART